MKGRKITSVIKNRLVSMIAIGINLNVPTAMAQNADTTAVVDTVVVSWVDTSLEGSEKFCLRVDGRPFYPTEIQIRLDKLYGYKGWNDAALEAVVKQAAEDGFNTVTLNTHWREVEPKKDVFDWTILDKYLGWCLKYGLKMEMMWFSWSSGGRVQYLWNYGGRKEPRTPDYVCSLSGTSDYNMLHNEWEYSLDWRDENLRERDTYVLSKVMEHIAEWDNENGNPHVVIGVQLGNEARGYEENTATAKEIIDYYSEVGSAVKNSPYVVWTRLNCVNGETLVRINANEAKREAEGTNIDFVGIDVYGGTASQMINDVGGQIPEVGKNFRMIMEAGADDSNSPVLQIAALAGGKAFDYYNMAVVDENCLYNADGTTLTPRGHIVYVRQRNKILNLANQEIALKAHRSSLYVYNSSGSSTSASTGLDGVKFKPGSRNTQAIGIKLAEGDMLLLPTSFGTFTFPENMAVESAEYGYMDNDNNWVSEGVASYTSTTMELKEACCVRIKYTLSTDVENICQDELARVESNAIITEGIIFDSSGVQYKSGDNLEYGLYIVKLNGMSERFIIQ